MPHLLWGCSVVQEIQLLYGQNEDCQAFSHVFFLGLLQSLTEHP